MHDYAWLIDSVPHHGPLRSHFGRKISHTPNFSRQNIGCARLSQKLKSPTKLTECALGAQTAKRVPHSPGRKRAWRKYFSMCVHIFHVYVSLELSPHHIECRQLTIVTTSIYIAHSWLLNVLQKNMNIIGHHWIRVPFSNGRSWLVSVELHVMGTKPHVGMMRFRGSEPGWFGLSMSQLTWGIASGMNISICSGENSGTQIGGANMCQPFITPSWPQVRYHKISISPKHSLKWHRTSTILHSAFSKEHGCWWRLRHPMSPAG